MKNLIIIGAGSAGNHLLNEILRKDDHFGYNIIGFLDANKEKHGTEINGFKVLGDHANLDYFIEKYNVNEIIIATTAIDKLSVEKIFSKAKRQGVKIKIIPSYEEILFKQPFTLQLRELNVEDLLGREIVKINNTHLNSYITNKTIFVTGAAGSIGSELVRQIIKYAPGKLILIDVNENDLYLLELFLKRHYLDIPVFSEICNVREKEKVEFLFEQYKPDILFHAAAHKHVPLMEKNVEEAVKNNILATNNLIELSADKLEKFVLISTDKAVNPTSVMGVTKRVAELLVARKNEVSETAFMAVRFGNVLGSNGSVIPIFKELLKERKNITITHPDVTRFFMTIPEAAQLVLEAGYLGKGGEVFVLDMGEPVKIMDLAKRMIEIYGLQLGKDVDIDIIGLRPGEKLYEELLYNVSTCTKTENNKIFISEIENNSEKLDEKIQELKIFLQPPDRNNLKKVLKEIVPEYQL